ncbi:MAG: hypothetical protein HZB19_01270 [Chloroflexi bacterium]|nr:hypothetical protein [Chloroflexota bacterium]
MKRFPQPAGILFVSLALALASCQPAPSLAPGDSLQLASSAQNDVEVIIALERGESDQFTLAATFTPLEPGLHIYSKDIPRKGVDGLGRPTLFEIPPSSAIQAIGEAMENVTPQCPASGPQELETYPTGPVTLRIPIILPDGNQWLRDQVSVTYMACDEKGCRAPVENKLIAIQLPGNEIIRP